MLIKCGSSRRDRELSVSEVTRRSHPSIPDQMQVIQQEDYLFTERQIAMLYSSRHIIYVHVREYLSLSHVMFIR